MNLSKYDNWKLDNGDKSIPIVGYCLCCDEEVCEGDSIMITPDGWVLKDHFEDYLKTEFDIVEGYAKGD